jgi:hypothetical protein
MITFIAGFIKISAPGADAPGKFPEKTAARPFSGLSEGRPAPGGSGGSGISGGIGSGFRRLPAKNKKKRKKRGTF